MLPPTIAGAAATPEAVARGVAEDAWRAGPLAAAVAASALVPLAVTPEVPGPTNAIAIAGLS